MFLPSFRLGEGPDILMHLFQNDKSSPVDENDQKRILGQRLADRPLPLVLLQLGSLTTMLTKSNASRLPEKRLNISLHTGGSLYSSTGSLLRLPGTVGSWLLVVLLSVLLTRRLAERPPIGHVPK
jgi:hypothetical protein